MITRRGLFGMLAAFPFVGKLFTKNEPPVCAEMPPETKAAFERLLDHVKWDHSPMTMTEAVMLDREEEALKEYRVYGEMHFDMPPARFVSWNQDGFTIEGAPAQKEAAKCPR